MPPEPVAYGRPGLRSSGLWAWACPHRPAIAPGPEPQAPRPDGRLSQNCYGLVLLVVCAVVWLVVVQLSVLLLVVLLVLLVVVVGV